MKADPSAESRQAELSRKVPEFCTLLRAEGFGLGLEHSRDALRALESVGVADLTRVRDALRSVCCGKREEFEAFERAFDGFFLNQRPGTKQPPASHRHTRPDGAAPPRQPSQPAPRTERAPQDDDDAASPAARERRPSPENASPAESWISLRERYSAIPAPAPAPDLAAGEGEAMLMAARRLVARIRRGRSRRWSPLRGGTRFDARRTLRGSVRTAGDPLVLHRLGHPLRNPRFVLLIDASGSMAREVEPMLHFARALNRATRRCATFVFSTGLREVSREFRKPGALELSASNLHEAWGGGTRIGASLRTFIRRDGARLLTPETFVLIFSDGLDVDEIGTLRRALHEIRSKAAGIVWLNPHAGRAGYVPSARGMRAALPYVDVFAPAANDAELRELAERF